MYSIWSCFQRNLIKSRLPYANLSPEDKRLVDKQGYENKAFDEEGHRRSAIPNEYEDFPFQPKSSKVKFADELPISRPTERGYVRETPDEKFHRNGSIEVVADVHKTAGARRKVAYNQRNDQSNLAGMGALSRMSQQSLLKGMQGSDVNQLQLARSDDVKAKSHRRFTGIQEIVEEEEDERLIWLIDR